MSEHEHIRVERDGFVTTVTLDRPQARNACTGDMWVTLGEIFRRVGHSGARVVVLTGAGGNFCTGADLSGAGAVATADGAESTPSPHLIHGMRVLGEAMAAVHRCSVPVIAKVDGDCVGAGLGLALAADLLWCSDRARFSAIFAKRGLSLDFGTSWLLRQRVGVHLAKQLAYTAELIGAERARDHYGLVNAVVAADTLDAAVAEVATTVAGGPPLALSMIKRQLDLAGTASLEQALELETLSQNVNVTTRDMQEAFMAYLEKRPAEFEGR